MAIAASVLSQRFVRANRFSQAIDAFFSRKDVRESKQESSIEKDLVALSPAKELGKTLTQFHKTTASNAELHISITTTSKSQTPQKLTDDPELQRDLDLMLRLVSKDEKHYSELKARFEKLMSLTQTSADEAVEEENIVQPQSSAGMTQEEMSASLARRNSYQLNLKLRQTGTIEEQAGITLEELGIKKVDPLVLDLGGEGINLTKAGEGSHFDITADGKTDQTAWVKGNTALLVYDRNGNSRIDDGSELFGDQNGAANGFAELAKYDANSDGVISRLDPIFKALKLYRDLNGDGRIDKTN
jgi:hypothetical protein